MTTLQTNFATQTNTKPKLLLARPMTASDIRGDIMGMQSVSAPPELRKAFENKCIALLGRSLVLVEPRSELFPQGQVIGYALIAEAEKIFPSGIALELHVIPEYAAKDVAYKTLIDKSARVCMAHGKKAMDILTDENDDPVIDIIAQEYGADFMLKGCEIGVHGSYTVSDLSGKFGYGAEKKAREALALKP